MQLMHKSITVFITLQYTIRSPATQYLFSISPTTQYDVLNLTITLIGATQPNATNQNVRALLQFDSICDVYETSHINTK